MDWTAAVSAAAVAVVVPLAFRMLANSPQVEGVVAYGVGARWLTQGLATIPSLAFLAIFAFQERPLKPGEGWAVAAIIALFPLVSSPLLTEFTRVRHGYDASRWRYRSPWSRHRDIAWDDVARVRWRPALRWLDFETRSGDRLHLSPLLGGLEGFAEAALAAISDDALADAEGRAALVLMARGHGGELAYGSLRPTQLRAAYRL